MQDWLITDGLRPVSCHVVAYVI